MKPIRVAGALALAAALAVPSVAAGHGSVYTSTAKLVPDATDPGTTVDETRYVVTNHGHTYALKETNNAVDPDADDNGGMIDYKVLPSAYRKRSGFTKTMLLAEGDTGAQPHATCRGVAALDEAAILAWQGADPFYNYVPWQKESAGLEDDPAEWIKVVKDTLDVDLTTADPAAACAAKGGTYTPADAIATSAAALAEGETVPLSDRITTLTKAVADADAATATLQGLLDTAKAEIAKLWVAATPLKATLPSARLKAKSLAGKGSSVTVTGVAGAPVRVELAIAERQARKLELKSSVLASAKATLGADGTSTVGLRAKQSARKALRKLKRSVAVTVTVRSGDRIATTGGTVTR